MVTLTSYLPSTATSEKMEILALTATWVWVRRHHYKVRPEGLAMQDVALIIQ